MADRLDLEAVKARHEQTIRSGWLGCDLQKAHEDRAALISEVEALREERLAMIESIPLDLAVHIIKLGPVEWGSTDKLPAEGHGEHIVRSVKATAKHFEQTEDQAMHGLYLEGTETVLCHTGTSPNSPQTARALTGGWNKLLELASLRARAVLPETETEEK